MVGIVTYKIPFAIYVVCFAAPFFFPPMFTKRKEHMFMNIQEFDIMNTLLQRPFVTQRHLAEDCGHSLGTVNR